MRKRLPFLSHLPLYTDIRFVELDLNRILSDETRQKYRAEFEKRSKKRRNKHAAEKRADAMATKKEEARIKELKARIQRIDPHDEFFHSPPEESLTEQDFPAASEGGGPIMQSPQAPAEPSALTFRSVLTTPSSMAMTEEAFPSLGGPNAVERTPAPPTWGRGWHEALAREKTVGDEQQLSESPTSQGLPVGKGKKSKGKKIVLFSTGGHRGSGYYS
jgi:hypothetical protein